ncbi:MAG: hypothetical protein NZ473_05710 [Candidatus Kapabacteria bacterium]|nr:hypothetical protein [Candidatus Kapabacteria bacterium]MCS7169542.1 hypothetical protein [Candidatus Kapabacteria bacterium]MDW7997666.1 hypothetical protein [Bacteroidota bacterium]MDW8225860.1 hypothetical protein [Bacteroidota bacterium]
MQWLRHLLRFEHQHEPLASSQRFWGRLAVFWLLVVGILGCVLVLGVLGYHWLGGLPWVDALLEAALILGGMGPLHPLPTTAAKLFAAFYALFSGLFFIAAIGVMLSPIFHRIAHRLHTQMPEDDYV